MRRIGILTAGGDTPALNATIYGAVERANERKVQMVGVMRGYAGLIDEHVPHVHLNPLFSTIPELKPTIGGSIIGSSRTYIGADSKLVEPVCDRLRQLQLDGLICIGGDGTINGMQPIAQHIPCVLAPKTIDNDLGLNYLDEPNEWDRVSGDDGDSPELVHQCSQESIKLEEIINYATPGYATAVFVAAQGIRKMRTTAESHRRIAIIEVMGRQSGFIALGTAYAQPDIILLPEVPIHRERLVQRIHQLYARQQHVVIVVGEGVIDENGQRLGDVESSVDPAGNVKFSGAAEQLQGILDGMLDKDLFRRLRPHEPESAVLFTRKVGHTQRGGRPILFDRFHGAALGGHAVDLLLNGASNEIATLQRDSEDGFVCQSISANKLRDRWQNIHPRCVHPSFYDAARFQISPLGAEYLRPIFANAIGSDDMEFIRLELFNSSSLGRPYQAVNVDIGKRSRTLANTELIRR